MTQLALNLSAVAFTDRRIDWDQVQESAAKVSWATELRNLTIRILGEVTEAEAEVEIACNPSDALTTMRSFMDEPAAFDPLEAAALRKMQALPVSTIQGRALRRVRD